MDTKYYTIEEIKELGDNKITEIIKNNILNSKKNNFIINLTFTYNNNFKYYPLFGDINEGETIFGDNIYTYSNIYYDKYEKCYIALNSKNFLNYVFNHDYKIIENIYNDIMKYNISIEDNSSLLFIFNNNTKININKKIYDLYNNLNLLFNYDSNDNKHIWSYILQNTKFNLSLKLHELSEVNFELKDNIGNYELRLYIKSIELPTNEFTKTLIKKNKKYKHYFIKYIQFEDNNINDLKNKINKQIIKNNNKINKLKQNNLNNEKIEKIEIINNKMINFLKKYEKEELNDENINKL